MAQDFDIAKADKAFAAQFFNDTWGFLDKAARSAEDTDAMIHCCHASFHHWTRVTGATPTNLAVGYWQLARVYAVAGFAAEAERYALRCMAAAKVPGAEGWVAGSAHEAIARAAALRGDRATRDEHLERAKAVAAGLTEKEDREILERDIATVP
jgi:hypothetical protein